MQTPWSTQGRSQRHRGQCPPSNIFLPELCSPWYLLGPAAEYFARATAPDPRDSPSYHMHARRESNYKTSQNGRNRSWKKLTWCVRNFISRVQWRIFSSTYPRWRWHRVRERIRGAGRVGGGRLRGDGFLILAATTGTTAGRTWGVVLAFLLRVTNRKFSLF